MSIETILLYVSIIPSFRQIHGAKQQKMTKLILLQSLFEYESVITVT